MDPSSKRDHLLSDRPRGEIQPGAGGGLTVVAPHVQGGLEVLAGGLYRARLQGQQTAQHLDVGLLTQQIGRASERPQRIARGRRPHRPGPRDRRRGPDVPAPRPRRESAMAERTGTSLSRGDPDLTQLLLSASSSASAAA